MEPVSKNVTRRRRLFALAAATLILATARVANGATSRAFFPTPSNAESISFALGSAGSVHAAFRSLDPAAPGAYYSFCASDCGNPANWTGLVVGTVGFFGGGVRLALTPQGQPRMMWLHDNPNTGNTYQYAECDAGCTNIANWRQGGVVTRTYGGYSWHTRYFALDPQGRPRFIYNDGAVGGGTFYYFCDGNCTAAVNWQQTQISPANLNLYSLVFDAQSRPRLAYRADDNAVGYATCDSGCGSGANWTLTPLYVLGGGSAVSLRLDSSGRPRIAFYQGSLGSGQTGDELLAYAWCDGGCAVAGNWNSLYPGFPRLHGKDVDLVLDANDRPQVVYYADTSPYGPVHAQCTANCEPASGTPTWEGEFIETSAELDASSPVAKKQGCSLSVWFPGEQPSLVLDAADNPLIGYNANHTQGGTCTAHSDIQLLRFASTSALTATSLSSSPNPSSVGQAVTFTATVSPVTAKGTVQFKDGAGNLGSAVTLSSGTATLTTSALSEGTHAITAVYSGDSSFDSSTSGTLNQIVGTSTLPVLTIEDRSVAEGSAVNAAFRVLLSRPSSQSVSVAYATAAGTASEGSDYQKTSGTLTFTPGRTQQSVYVPIVTDNLTEGSESFHVNLSSAVNATIGDGQALGTIGDPPTAVHAAMYRAYNANTDYHFFTTDLSSKNFAVGVLGFRDESTPVPFYVWNAGQAGTVPLFRMYNPNLGRHFYTAGVGNRDFLMGIGAVYEKEEGFVYPLGTSPVPSGATELFLLYNNNSGTHLFTADAGQKNAILNLFPGIWVSHTSVGLVFTSP